MIIRYKLRGEEPTTIDLAGFNDFRVWLHDLGAGDDVTAPDILARWAVLYRELADPDFRPRCIGLSRVKFGAEITLLGGEKNREIV